MKKLFYLFLISNISLLAQTSGFYSATESCTDGSTFDYTQEILVDGNNLTLVNAFGWSNADDNNVTVPINNGSISEEFIYSNQTDANGLQTVVVYDIYGTVVGNTINLNYVMYTVDDATFSWVVTYNCDVTYESDPVLGCTDATADNYDSTATEDDGSCQYTVLGCTDVTADNYDSTATEDDGSCTYSTNSGLYSATESCTDGSTFDYTQEILVDGNNLTLVNAFGWSNADDNNVTVPINNGSISEEFIYSNQTDANGLQTVVVYDIYGTVVGNTINLNYIMYTVDDATFSWVETYNCDVTYTFVSSSDPVLGCTDMTADNYDSTATEDDGSCIYSIDANSGIYSTTESCTDGVAYDYDQEILVDGTNVTLVNAFGWSVAVDNNITLEVTNNTFEAYSVPSQITNSENTTFQVQYDIYNGSITGNTITCSYDIFIDQEYYDGCDVTFVFSSDLVLGCTDVTADNYDSTATSDDGSCISESEVEGCTDSSADNYNPSATEEDGSCEYSLIGCTDEAANNYNSTADLDDGSCTYSSFGCIDITACNYNIQASIDDGSCSYFDVDPGVISLPATFTGEESVDGNLSSSYNLIFYEDGTALSNNGFEFSYSICSSSEGNAFIYIDSDSYSGEFNTNNLTISGSSPSGAQFEYSFTEDISPIMGCADEIADNFNIQANFDDGSCIYSDAEAFVGNYSVTETCSAENYNYTQEIISEGNTITLINAFGWSTAEAYDNNITLTINNSSFSAIGTPSQITNQDGVVTQVEYDIDGYIDGDFLVIQYSIYIDQGNGMEYYDGCDANFIMIPYFGDAFDGTYDYNESCTDESTFEFDQIITSNGNEITLIEAFGWGVDITIPLDDESVFSLYDYETTIEYASGTVYGVTYSSIEGQLLDGNIDVTYVITTEDENGSMQEFSNCSATMTYSNELIEGCTDSIACNYNEAATIDDGSCSFPALYYDCEDDCVNDVDSDGVCDQLEVEGCTDPLATNYESYATDDNGSCIPVIDGCTDTEACNYNAEANNENGSCQYTEMYYDCDGNCLSDSDDDGICDELEINGCTDMLASNYNPLATENDESCNYDGAGCMDETACNYNVDAIEDDGSCMYAQQYYDCDGNCIEDNDENGICDQFQIGCPYEEFVEYDSTAFYFDVNLCETYIVYGCTNANYLEYDSLATNDDNSCETLIVYGCTNQTATNYNPQATIDDASCNIYGCTLEIYPNYNSEATVDDGSCSMSSDFIYGCMDDMACNFNENATNENGSCIFAVLYYDCDGNCTNDSDSDGVCDELEVEGCTDPLACNFNPNATNEDESCENAEIYFDCSGNCINDSDDDGVCDELEVEGCTDPLALNYDSNATDDDLTCVYSIEGCTDSLACNFNSFATDDDDSCVYEEMYYDCDGNCINDADGDGICDELEDVGINEVNSEKAELIKIIDVLGREQLNPKKGMILFYIYSNGVVEKRLIH